VILFGGRSNLAGESAIFAIDAMGRVTKIVTKILGSTGRLQ
jgi:hypothetical protein